MKFFVLIWSNLKRKKVRTILTLLSIVVAFILFAVLSSIKQALTGGVSMAGATRLIVQHKVSIIQTLPYSYKARMLRIPGVELVSDQTWFGGKFQREPKYWFMQCPVEPEDFLAMVPEISLPPEQKQKWLQTRTGAIVGRTLRPGVGDSARGRSWWDTTPSLAERVNMLTRKLQVGSVKVLTSRARG